MVLYNKRAVKNKKQPCANWLQLINKYNPIHLNGSAKKVQELKTRKKPMNLLEDLITQLHKRCAYDSTQSFPGLRTAEQVWKDKKGNCIEQNTLLTSASLVKKAEVFFIITKNPAGYDGSDLNEVGIHPFVGFNHKDKLYLGDCVAGTILPAQEVACCAYEFLNFRELVAFFLHFHGEELGLGHAKYKQALNVLKTASLIDPNNYTIYLTMADVYFNNWVNNSESSDWHLQRAKNCYTRAINIAPDLLDVYKEYGDFCFQVYKNPERAIKLYSEALKRETSDLQVLISFGVSLGKLDEKKLFNLVKEKINKITKV